LTNKAIKIIYIQENILIVRIKADNEVIIKPEDKTVSRIVRDYSKNADPFLSV